MNNRFQTQSQTSTAIDEGLRQHFIKVYNVMALGLAITGIVAYAVSQIPPLVNLLFGTPLGIVVAFLPLIFVFFGFSHKAVMTKSAGQLKTLFFGFSAVFGLSMAAIFIAYATGDIARAFFITAATFAAMSIFGYTTKRDLSKLGSFLFMGVIGLLIAMVVNLFLASTMLDFMISCAGVLIYTVMTAFDTQNIKESYSNAYSDEDNSKMAVMGALSLYINFIMLFQFILSLLSGRE